MYTILITNMFIYLKQGQYLRKYNVIGMLIND